MVFTLSPHSSRMPQQGLYKLNIIIEVIFTVLYQITELMIVALVSRSFINITKSSDTKMLPCRIPLTTYFYED